MPGRGGAASPGVGGERKRHHFSMPWFERAAAPEPPLFFPFSLPSFLALLHNGRVSFGLPVMDQRRRCGVKVFPGLERLRAEHEGPVCALSRV